MYSVPTIKPSGASPVQLVPVTPELLVRLERAALADRGHRVIAPTHVALRGQQVIGYVSCGAVPMLFGWMDTEKATAKETFAVWHAAEAVLSAAGHGQICLPCEPDSPLMTFVGKLGYELLGSATFNLKTLSERK